MAERDAAGAVHARARTRVRAVAAIEFDICDADAACSRRAPARSGAPCRARSCVGQLHGRLVADPYLRELRAGSTRRAIRGGSAAPGGTVRCRCRDHAEHAFRDESTPSSGQRRACIAARALAVQAGFRRIRVALCGAAACQILRGILLAQRTGFAEPFGALRVRFRFGDVCFGFGDGRFGLLDHRERRGVVNRAST